MPTITALAAAASAALPTALAATDPAGTGGGRSALDEPVLLIIGGVVLVLVFGGIVLRTLRRNRLRK